MADFSEAQIQAVWEKGICADNNDSNIYRKDICGAWISRSNYDNRNSIWGWEIDHIVPLSKGGSDAISNLQPLHWENNAAKADGNIVCVVISDGMRNLKK